MTMTRKDRKTAAWIAAIFVFVVIGSIAFGVSNSKATGGHTPKAQPTVINTIDGHDANGAPETCYVYSDYTTSCVK